MTNKRGMELSINALVVIILGIMILGGGIFFIQNLVGVAEDTLRAVDSNSQAEITNLLASGQTIVVLQNSRTGTYGTYVFATGFVNHLGTGHNFTVNVTSPTHVIRTNGSLIPISNLARPLFDEQKMFLEHGESVNNLPFAVSIPRGNPQGTYEYYFEVLSENSTGGWELYSGARLVRVTIR